MTDLETRKAHRGLNQCALQNPNITRKRVGSIVPRKRTEVNPDRDLIDCLESNIGRHLAREWTPERSLSVDTALLVLEYLEREPQPCRN